MFLSKEAEQAVKDYFDYYSDEYMRLSLMPRLASKLKGYDNENPHLFTGMFATLMATLGVYDEQFMYQLDVNMQEAMVVEGLYGRQSVGLNGYPKNHPQHGEFNTVSHDEYNGIIMQSIYIMRKDLIDDVVDYGKQNKYCYDDSEPYKFNMRYMRQPRDTYFYKSCSELYAPSTLEKVWFLASTFLTSRSKGVRVDGELMLFYKFLTFRLAGYSSRTVSMAENYYTKKMVERFGTDWVVALHQLYFKANKHPIHVLAAEVQERMQG